MLFISDRPGPRIWQFRMGFAMKAAFALLLIVLFVGCHSVAEEGVHRLSGESRQERADRHKMEDYRSAWSTPGRTDSEIEAEAAGTFRRANGRDPNLNWSAR